MGLSSTFIRASMISAASSGELASDSEGDSGRELFTTHRSSFRRQQWKSTSEVARSELVGRGADEPSGGRGARLPRCLAMREWVLPARKPPARGNPLAHPI